MIALQIYVVGSWHQDLIRRNAAAPKGIEGSRVALQSASIIVYYSHCTITPPFLLTPLCSVPKSTLINVFLILEECSRS